MAVGGGALLLPPRARLLYIGPPKTGTTAVQEAARAARSTLYQHGVYYPGRRRNHRREIYALLGQPYQVLQRAAGERAAPGATPEQAMWTPPPSEWRALMADIQAEDTRRILISHEAAAGASDEVAERFVRELGRDRIHVAISLRSLASVIPSWWNELVKSGPIEPFERVLERLYGRSEPPVSPVVRQYFDQGGLVERWARAAGPDHVTVIIADPSNKSLLPEAFERMLALPAGTLSGANHGGFRTNRSLTRTEAELFRQVNAAIPDPAQMSWPVHAQVLQSGAIAAILDGRVPDVDEPRILMPRWAADLALRDGREHADRIARSGARVVGDLTALYAQPATADDAPTVGADIPMAIAVQALLGALDGATRCEHDTAASARRVHTQLRRAHTQLRTARARLRRSRERERALRARTVRDLLDALPAGAAAATAAESFRTRDLARAVLIRVARRLRFRRADPAAPTSTG